MKSTILTAVSNEYHEKHSQSLNTKKGFIQTGIFFIISFIFVLLFSRSTSFLYVFEGSDPSVFKQMGEAILRGKIIYIDYFDNKGCLLYFLHAFCLWLGGDFAILLLQTISLTATLSIWNQMLLLYRTKRQSMLFLIIALILLLCFYGAGDQTQEWCLPFISYPLLLFLRSHKNNHDINKQQIFIIGLCFGIITFIQVNNACAFIGFVVYLWIENILNKDFRKLLQSMGWFAVGWLIIALPCVLYFFIKAGWHGVYEMVYASFLSNFEYIGSNFNRRLFFIVPYILFILTFTLLTVVNSYQKKGQLISILISILLFIVTFGKLCNMYYLMAILPLCIVTMSTLHFEHNRKIKIGLCGILALCSVYYLSNPLLHFVEDLIRNNERELTIYDDFHQCISNIPENERDSIYNYNLHSPGTSMMQHEGLLQCNRVLFTSLAFALPTLWEEETNKPFIPPKWMLISYEKKYIKDDAYFIANQYEIVCSFHYDKVYFRKPYVGDEFDVYLYRRKE